MQAVKPDLPGPIHLQWFLAAVLVGISAAAILCYSLPWGVGVSPDSIAYLKSAGRLLEEFKFQHLPRSWPPAYPFYLALLASMVSNIMTAALLGQALLFALNTSAFALVIHRCLGTAEGGGYWLALVAAVLFASNPAVLLVHQYAVSEALFIFCLLLSTYACLWYLDKEERFRLLVTALLVGCLPIIRYAGMPFIGIFCALVFFGRPGTGQRRSKRMADALLLATVAALPLVCWLTLNRLFRGESTDKTFAFHPVSATHMKTLAGVFFSWFEVPGSSVWTILVVIVVCYAILRAASLPQIAFRQKALLIVLPLGALFYTLFLLVSVTVVDANVPLDQRVLLPAWILLIVAIFIGLHIFVTSRVVFGVLLIAIAAVFVEYGLKSATQIEYSRKYGLGFNTPGAATSPLLNTVKAEYPKRKLYSNASDYVYLHTSLEIQSLPRIYNAATRERNRRFIYEMATILEEIDNQKAAIVYFEGFEFRQYYPSAKQLKDEFSLDAAQHTSSGLYLNTLK